MKQTLFLLLFVWLSACGKRGTTLEIIISGDADKMEILAANELSKYLTVVYPGFEFPVSSTGRSERKIYLGVQEHIPHELLADLEIPLNVEGYRIHHPDDQTGIITSAGSSGVLYGVYELMEALGYSFVYSGDYAPPQREEFSFDPWSMVNEPLVQERTVFNWHNFLSGCTAWDDEDWALWIDQSQKMGYNTIMVHAYANNPMFTFEYKGITKEVGYLTTSVQGRDWSTEHVNDIRRLPGGAVFDSPVFGSQAGQVSGTERIDAAQKLMGRVFQHAEERGVKVNFALDFDIMAAIPQEMVELIPETDRFSAGQEDIAWMGQKEGQVWLPNPEQPEGYNYYRKQVETVLELYPQIDKLVLWRRRSGTVWNELKFEEMPAPWQKEYREIVESKPEISDMNQSVGVFAQSKLAIAYRKAFDEFSRSDVDIAYGTWGWSVLRAMNEFYPDFTSVYILDSEVIRGEEHLHNQEIIDDMSSWLKEGKLIPVIWPHHDDGAYLGSPLPSYKNFYSTLSQLHSDGYGVIHWMTRPFDMYFIHHSKQVMRQSTNQSLDLTLEGLAEKWFGETNAMIMSHYLKLYEREMPSFGRETIPYFIDEPHYFLFGNVSEVMARSDERVAVLRTVDTLAFSDDQKFLYNYFVEYEEFVSAFFYQQGLYLDFESKFESGNLEAAKAIADQFNPATVLEQYARTIRNGNTTKGEKGVLYSMGLRWVPHFLTLQQLVGNENIRINFGSTSHEQLAQVAGKRTYFIDNAHEYWKVMGEEETGLKVMDISASAAEYDEIFEQGVLIDTPMSFALNTFTSEEKIIPGKYKLKLLLASAEESCRIRVRVDTTAYELRTGGATIKTIDVELSGNLNPLVEIEPLDGTPVFCGIILERVM